MLRTVISFFISIIFIWIIGYFFCDSPIYYKLDSKLKSYIHAPFIVYKHRSEGSAETYKGLLGINYIKNINEDTRKKIIIWGDSYVEAHQVNDDKKIPQVVSKLLDEKNLGDKYMCFGVGMSGNNVADYYFDIPKYEELVENVVAHYILITGMDDILPDKPGDNRGIFKSNPFVLYHDNWRPEHQEIKKILNDAKIYFAWDPFKAFMNNIKGLKFIPKNKYSQNNDYNSKDITLSSEFFNDSWTYLLKNLRKQSKLPITIVYSPQVPEIKNNTIYKKDKNADDIKLFSEIALRYNIKVIDSTELFVDFFDESGAFPRGFSNSKPSTGHFNENGHAIVSELIVNDFVAMGVR